jgi:adenosylcobinamide-GDP ribazoletransferase
MNEQSDSGAGDQAPAAWWRDLQVATVFLTRLRWPSVAAFELSALNRASRVFPVVGVVMGLGGGIVYAIADGIGLVPWLAAALAVAAIALLTGALHEDGLADTADGFAGGKDREDRLAIMRDSRIGSVGALALIFSVLLRVTALAALAAAGTATVVGALIAAHAVSRAGMTAVMHLLPNARDDGLSAAVGRPSRVNAGIALGIGAIVALVMMEGAGIVGLLAAAAAVAALAALAKRGVGGQTGDVLGAAEQTAQAAFLLAIGAAL